jgi:hypothetical protein
MSDTLPNLGLKTRWASGTYYKTEMESNLLKLDSIVGLSVKSRSISLPGSPSEGDRYITGSAYQVAVRESGAWTYYTPEIGWSAYVEDEDELVYFTGSEWQKFCDFGGGLIIERNTHGKIIIDMNDDDYTMTAEEAHSAARVLINTGDGTKTLTMNITDEPNTGALSVISLGFAASDVTLHQPSTLSDINLVAGSNNIIMWAENVGIAKFISG